MTKTVIRNPERYESPESKIFRLRVEIILCASDKVAAPDGYDWEDWVENPE